MKVADKSYLKTVSTDTTQFVDKTTAEDMGRSTVRKEIVVASRDEYFLMYARMVSMQADLTGAEIKVFGRICMMIAPNEGSVVLNKAVKSIIAKDTKLKAGSVHQAVYNLCRKGLLIKNTKPGFERSAMYFVHPDYAWRGNSNGREKVLKTVLTLIRQKGDE